jgi:hypothetical protein
VCIDHLACLIVVQITKIDYNTKSGVTASIICRLAREA